MSDPPVVFLSLRTNAHLKQNWLTLLSVIVIINCLRRKKISYEQKIISAEKIVEEEEEVLKEITNRERKKLKLS